MLNHPDHWIALLPLPGRESHKYRRGHVVVLGGIMPGASRLAALSALRAGAGIVTLLCLPEHYAIQAGALTAVIVRPVTPEQDMLSDVNVNTVLFGPGADESERTRRDVMRILDSGKAVVLDAGALGAWAADRELFFRALHANVVLTPHTGEFTRLFGAYDDKEAATLHAAQQCGAVVMHKGADTVIAAPDGRVCMNRHASAWLATAGTGDVLAGICAGLMGQGMPAFEAACAAAWMQGDAARRFGPGLIADDLPAMLPKVWDGLCGVRADDTGAK